MNEPFLRYEKTDRIVTLTMQRPDSRNAIAEHEDCRELVDAFETANADPDVSVLILTGSGSAFCAGGNVKNMRDRVGIGALDSPAETRANYKRGVQRIPLAMMNLEIA